MASPPAHRRLAGTGSATFITGAGVRLGVDLWRVRNLPHMIITGVNPMFKKLRVLMLLAVVIGLAIPGLAADEKKYRFEFFGGVSYPISKNFTVSYPQADQPFEGKQDWSIGPRGGVRMGIEGARHWGQDYTFSYGTNATDIRANDASFSFTNHFYEATTNVLYYPKSFVGRKTNFFLTAGLGAMWVNINRDAVNEAINPGGAGIGEIRNEVKFSFNAGAGVRIRLNERFGIRFDVRDYMSPAIRYGLPESSSDPNAIVFPVENTQHQLFGSVSLVIHF